MRTLVVIPTYEEAQNIARCSRGCGPRCPTSTSSSSTTTAPTAPPTWPGGRRRARADRRPRARPRRTASATPTATASASGIERGYDVLVQMDADLSHDPAALPSLLAALDDGAEPSIGSRYVPGGSVPHWPWYRRALSKWGNRYACFVLGMTVHDATAGLPRLPGRRAQGDRRVHARAPRATASRSRRPTASRAPAGGSPRSRSPSPTACGAHSKMSLGVMSEELLLVTWWGIRDRLAGLLGPGSGASPPPAPGPPAGSTGRRAGPPASTRALDVGDALQQAVDQALPKLASSADPPPISRPAACGARARRPA